MANYEETKVKLTNYQLKKLKSRLKTTLIITKTNFQGEELAYELFLKIRKKK